MEAEIYTVLSIEEPDFGCEGIPEGQKPICRVELQRADGSVFYATELDEVLYARSIDEGCRVRQDLVDGLLLYKTIRVVAAVICDDMAAPTTIFATARGYGEYKGQWEFPGGKIEAGETPEAAIVREIREELDAVIEPGPCIHTIEYDYLTFHLSMDCFLAQVTAGELRLKEAADARWLTAETLDSVQWLPADATLIEQLRGLLCSREGR